MKRSLASQILDRGRSNGCAHNLANDGEKRGSNDTLTSPRAAFHAGLSPLPKPWRLSIQFKATAAARRVLASVPPWCAPLLGAR